MGRIRALFPGLSFLFDTFTFLQTNWSPLKVPMYTANELAVGCVLTVAGVLSLSGPTLKRTLLRVRIGVALILIAAAVYGGWEWWMATRTWVPLYMPVSLAQGHIRSPEFKINLDAGFWIFVEVETKVDDEGVSCLTGYTSDYCSENGVRELHASWTLSDSGRVVARGSTDNDKASLGGMVAKPAASVTSRPQLETISFWMSTFPKITVTSMAATLGWESSKVTIGVSRQNEHRSSCRNFPRCDWCSYSSERHYRNKEQKMRRANNIVNFARTNGRGFHWEAEPATEKSIRSAVALTCES